MTWFKIIIRKVAEEAHKSKIAELEQRITEMEKDHKVMQKTIADNESKITELQKEMFKSSIFNAKMEATFDTVLRLGEKNERR